MSNWAAEVEAQMAAANEQQNIADSLRRQRAARNVLRGFCESLSKEGLTPAQVLAALAVVAGEIATQEVA